MARRHQISAASTFVFAAGFLFIDALAASASFGAAPIDPGLTQALIGRCAVVAEEEARGINTRRGECIAGTGEWIAALHPVAANSADTDTAIADLVVKLAALAQGNQGCTAFNTEIAEAIRLASAASTDPQQKVRIEDIATTIGDCVPQLQTAAINASPSI